MKQALLVIDAQKIYSDPDGALFCAGAKKAITNMNKLIRYFAAQKLPVFYIRHIHKSDGSDLGRMFDYAGPVENFNFKDGSQEVEYSDGLKIYDKGIEIKKTRYSAFAQTDLLQQLHLNAIEKVVITGFMTNFCCMTTAIDAHAHDFYVDFIIDAIDSPGLETMNGRKLKKVVGEMIGSGFGVVKTAKDFLAV